MRLSSLFARFTVKETLRFIVGGISAVLTDFLVYVTLKNWVDYSIAKAISYIAGAVVGFLINKYWTFESKKFRFAEIIVYSLLYISSALANAWVNHAVFECTGLLLVAFFIATAVSTVINFLGQKFLVFRRY